MISAAPWGIRSERISSELMRRFDCTSPPRWLMPCTSACLMWSPSLRAAAPMTVAIERMPCPPTPESMMSRFMVVLLFFALWRLAVWMHSRRGMMTETPLYSISSRIVRRISSMFLGRGTTTRMCSGSTPSPAQICSRRPVPAESWPPVMPVVRLSEITTVMLLFHSRHPAGRSCPSG